MHNSWRQPDNYVTQHFSPVEMAALGNGRSLSFEVFQYSRNIAYYWPFI